MLYDDDDYYYYYYAGRLELVLLMMAFASGARAVCRREIWMPYQMNGLLGLLVCLYSLCNV